VVRCWGSLSVSRRKDPVGSFKNQSLSVLAVPVSGPEFGEFSRPFMIHPDGTEGPPKLSLNMIPADAHAVTAAKASAQTAAILFPVAFTVFYPPHGGFSNALASP
jgi:hypothetical protein